MKRSARERELEQQIDKLKRQLDALEEHREPDWAERTSEFLHKGKSLAIETVALLSLLAAGGHIVANEFSGFHREVHHEEEVQVAKKDPAPKGDSDFELLRQTLLRNEAVTRQTIGDAEFERLKATLDSLHTTEQERTHRRNLPCPCGSGKKFKNCCAQESY